MDLKALKLDVNMTVWLKFAGYTAAIIAGLAFYNYLTVANYSKKLIRITSKILYLEAKNTRYENFAAFKSDLLRSDEEIRGLLSSYEGILIGEQKSQNTFLDRISETSVKSKVKLDKITPGETKAGKYWDISCTSDYRSICEFFALTEKYFKVENFKIWSGELEPQHKVNVRVSALIGAAAPAEPAAKNKDIFDLFSDASDLLNAIKSKENAADSAQIQVEIDPMSYAQTIFPMEKKPEEKKRKAAVAEGVPYKVEGIFWDPSTPVVVINGQALKEKENYNDMTVDKISEDSVSVTWKGKKYNLKKQ